MSAAWGRIRADPGTPPRKAKDKVRSMRVQGECSAGMRICNEMLNRRARWGTAQ